MRLVDSRRELAISLGRVAIAFSALMIGLFASVVSITPAHATISYDYGCLSTQQTGDCLGTRTLSRTAPTCMSAFDSHTIKYDIWACDSTITCTLSNSTRVTVETWSGDPDNGGTHLTQYDATFGPCCGTVDHFKYEYCVPAGYTIPDYFVVTISGGCGTEDVKVTICCRTTGCG
jgi:hypothetical protein